MASAKLVGPRESLQPKDLLVRREKQVCMKKTALILAVVLTTRSAVEI